MQADSSISTPSTPSRLAEWVAQMPRPAPDVGILSKADDEAMRKAVAEILKGGRESIVGLVDMLTEPGAGKSDSQARHALHAVVIHAGAAGDGQRRAVAAALASTLSQSTRPAGARAFVVRQLQLCGGRQAAGAVGPLLLDEKLYADAAMALLAIRDGAAEQFRAALPKTTGRMRVTAIHGLGTLKDASSAEALRKQATGKDKDARMMAWWALARIGDAGSVDLLTRAADAAPEGEERIKATSACLILAETLTTAGDKQQGTKIYRHLRDTRTDASERYIRQAAAAALGD